ncbi:MAG TPA: response regulator, partial [Burkholderiaceae bacterium]
MTEARALIVDDEPLLRTHLAHHLAQLWPELEIAGEARNGREAVDLAAAEKPDVVFLDVHMPGMNGVEAARLLGPDVQIVFVTAYEQYAVAAFEQGAIDYLVKPFEVDRLAESVARLRRRLAERRRLSASPAAVSDTAPTDAPALP